MIKDTGEKKAIHSDYSFKVKLFFYNSNSGLQYDTQEILDDQNLHESTIEALNAIVSEISKKNRLIRTTDRSLPGWVTIAE